MSGNGHFDRINAMVDRGYVGALPSTELRVLLVFERHADRHGVAWPSPQTVADKLGITTRNVQRAIASLVTRGILTGGKVGSGRGHVTKRSIVIPENPAQRATFSTKKNPAQRGKKTRRRVAVKPGAGRSENPAQCAGRRDLEQTNEHPTTTTQAGCGGGGRFFQEWMGKSAEKKYVSRHGVDHCLRVADLVNALIAEGKCDYPKRMFHHLLELEVEDVDFQPLEDHEEGERMTRMLEESRQKREREEQELEQAKTILAGIPDGERDKWRELFRARIPAGTDENALRILSANIVVNTPDVDEALAELEGASA